MSGKREFTREMVYECEEILKKCNVLRKALKDGVCLTFDDSADEFNYVANIETDTSISASNVFFKSNGEKTCWAYTKKELIAAVRSYCNTSYADEEDRSSGIVCRVCSEDADHCRFPLYNF